MIGRLGFCDLLGAVRRAWSGLEWGRGEVDFEAMRKLQTRVIQHGANDK